MTANVNGMSMRPTRASQVKCSELARINAASKPARARPQRYPRKQTNSTQPSADNAAGRRTAQTSTGPPFSQAIRATSQ